MDEEEEQRKNTFKPLIFICEQQRERERTEQQTSSRKIVKKERRIKIASLRLVVAFFFPSFYPPRLALKFVRLRLTSYFSSRFSAAFIALNLAHSDYVMCI